MTEQEVVRVHTAHNRGEANVVAALLRSHGIRCAVVSDSAGGQEPQLEFVGRVWVVVSAEDAPDAQRLIEDSAT